MKRILAVGILAAIGLAAMAQTCVVTNEALTEIDGHDVFAGELQNDSGVDILHHRFRVAFVNENGAVVETVTVDGCLRSLQDGASDFFSAASRLPSDRTDIGLGRMANIAEDPGFEIGTVEEGDVVVNDVVATREGTVLTIEGTITNEDDDTLEDPVVCGIVWNEDNRIIVTAKVSDLEDLESGESAEFTITITVPDDADEVDQVDVWADGLEDGDPVEPSSLGDVDVTPIPTTTPTVTPTATNTSTATVTPTAAITGTAIP